MPDPAHHACRSCSRAFSTRDALDRHVRRVHGGRERPAPAAWLALAAALVLLGGGGAYAIYNAAAGGPEADFDLDGEPMLGDPDAPAVLVAFEDPSCPFCRAWHVSDGGESTFERLVDSYVARGELRIHYKSFNSAKPWGPLGTVAQECAFDQGNDAFWTLTDRFYRDQARIDSGNVRAASLGYAEAIGLDVDSFRECFDEEAPKARIRAEMRTGRDVGVTGTPAFFIMGRTGEPELIVGPQDHAVFAGAIERALAKG